MAGFLFEPLTAGRIVGHLRRQDLQCHIAAQACIAGAVNFHRAARADGRDDFVGAEFCTGCSRDLYLTSGVNFQTAELMAATTAYTSPSGVQVGR
jgi:hypothetical protein